RESASIVGLPKLLPHAVGFRFAKEVENLSKVFENPAHPLLFIVGGSKKDKLDYIKSLESLSDKILVGGRLPEYYGDLALESVRNRGEQDKLIIANLVQDKEDITLNSIERFEKEIEKAKTIVLAGPMGKYEEEGHRQGTERVFKAVAGSSTFKVAGGGDTERAISELAISDKFDWISVGGGAMLEFLAKRTLPGIEALESANVKC
ncbi:MAG: phosphoglycerate kinase, partial [Candidatus Woesebacteria bacterium]|nr:phosphoglycerate kinase [Candidatus Woesebacteria bacterium]